MTIDAVRTNLERVAHVVVTVVAGAIHGQRFFLAVHLFFGELRSAVSVERGGLLQLDEGFGLFTHMKSAVLAAIFGITGGVAILLAVPAEENATVVKILPAKWTGEYGAPVVPQIEEEEVVPELLEHYSVAQTKTEKPAPRRHRHVARLRPNFFEKLVAGFVKLQKHQPSKSIL